LTKNDENDLTEVIDDRVAYALNQSFTSHLPTEALGTEYLNEPHSRRTAILDRVLHAAHHPIGR